MKTNLKTTIIAASLFGAASLAQGATTVTTVEGALGNGNGIYMDLQSSTTGFTNQGVTGIWSNWTNSWGFTSQGASTGNGGTANGPGDTSDNSITVFGRSADDKNSDPEIQVDYTGLQSSTAYKIWAVVVQDTRRSTNTHDFEWGTTSGSLTRVVGNASYPNATLIAGSTVQLVGVPLSQVTTDANGDITLYYDNGLDASGSYNTNRTQLDGVLFEAVPEPSASLTLLTLVGLSFLRRRRN